jgi:hypothetical protein
VAPLLEFVEGVRFEEEDIRRLRDEPSLSASSPAFFDSASARLAAALFQS